MTSSNADVYRLEHEYRRRAKRRLPLPDFIPTVSPELTAPHHLKPYTDLLQRAAHQGDARGLVSTPPQHGKSQTTLHALIHALLRNPTKRHAYATYAQQFARDQSRIAKRIAERAGLELATVSADRWVTPEGGGIVWTGVGGPLTGHAIDGLLVFDDLLKNRQDAESTTVRNHAMDWLSSVAMTRLHPGASAIGIATRWHTDDPHGRLAKAGWEYIKLPAITDAGEALWPEARPLAWLEAQRTGGAISEYDWWALYMCEPRPRGGALYQDAHYYDHLPQGGYKAGCGADWAYTARTHADYSVALEGRLYGDTIYVTRMIRAQVEAPQFAEMLMNVEAREITSFMSGTEKALEQFIRKHLGIRIRRINANTDKFVRAQASAAAWNAGKILLPRSAPWVAPLLDEVLAFTGVSDAHDDTVDALAGLHHALLHPGTADRAALRRAMGVA